MLSSFLLGLGTIGSILLFVLTPVSLIDIPVIGAPIYSFFGTIGGYYCGLSVTVPYLWHITSVFIMILWFEMSLILLRYVLGSNSPEKR